MSGNMTIQTGNTHTSAPVYQTGGTTPPTTQTGSGIGGSQSTIPVDRPQPRSFEPTTSTTGPATRNTGQADNRLASTDRKLDAALADLEKLIKTLKGVEDLATILIDLASMQRQAALDQRLASREIAKSQLLGQAAETRQAAMKEIVAAVVSLVMSVVTAGITLTGAIKAGGKIKDAMGDLKDVAEKTSNMNKLIKNGVDEGSDAIKNIGAKIKSIGNDADVALRQAENITMKFNAISQMVNALGDAMAAMIRASGKMDEAQGQALAAEAQDTQAEGDAFKALMDGIDELIRTAIEFVKKMQDAEVELMATASRL